MRELLCRLLRCAFKVVPDTYLVQPIYEPWNFGFFDPDGWERVDGPVRACRRCGHYEGSAVCAGQRPRTLRA